MRVTTNCPRADGLLGGRYVLHEVLGIGSSAVVHRAEDVRTGQAVAVKKNFMGLWTLTVLSSGRTVGVYRID